MLKLVLALAFGIPFPGARPFAAQGAAAEAPPAPARDEESRYQVQWIRIRPDDERFVRLLRGDQQLKAFGDFRRAEAGETLELAALRLGLTPARMARMNPRAIEGLGTLCADFRHRCLPGEDLALLASLYDVEPAVLRELNDLKSGEEPEAWDEICVPSPLHLVDGLRQLRLPIPVWSRWSEGRLEGAAKREREGDEEVADGLMDLAQGLVGQDAGNSLRFLHRLKTRVARADDTWESLAEAAHCSAEALRNINTDAGSEAPAAGSPIRIGWRLELRPDHGVELLALYFEHYLRLDLDLVLRANGLEDPREMLEAAELFLPFSSSMGYEPVTMREDSVTLAPVPGCQVTLHFKGGPDGVTHELRFD